MPEGANRLTTRERRRQLNREKSDEGIVSGARHPGWGPGPRGRLERKPLSGNRRGECMCGRQKTSKSRRPGSEMTSSGKSEAFEERLGQITLPMVTDKLCCV